MSATVTSRQNWSALLALAAALVSAAVLVIEGPPGSGYGWGSVVVSVAISSGLLVAMAWLVRSDSRGQAEAGAVVAVVTALLFGASLLGNWAVNTTTFRILDSVSTLFAVSASVAVFFVSLETFRHVKGAPPQGHATA